VIRKDRGEVGYQSWYPSHKKKDIDVLKHLHNVGDVVGYNVGENVGFSVGSKLY